MELRERLIAYFNYEKIENFRINIFDLSKAIDNGLQSEYEDIDIDIEIKKDEDDSMISIDFNDDSFIGFSKDNYFTLVNNYTVENVNIFLKILEIGFEQLNISMKPKNVNIVFDIFIPYNKDKQKEDFFNKFFNINYPESLFNQNEEIECTELEFMIKSDHKNVNIDVEKAFAEENNETIPGVRIKNNYIIEKNIDVSTEVIEDLYSETYDRLKDLL